MNFDGRTLEGIKIVSAGLATKASTLTVLPENLLFLGSKVSDSWVLEYQPVLEDKTSSSLDPTTVDEPDAKRPRIAENGDPLNGLSGAKDAEISQEVDDIEQSIANDQDDMGNEKQRSKSNFDGSHQSLDGDDDDDDDDDDDGVYGGDGFFFAKKSLKGSTNDLSASLTSKDSDLLAALFADDTDEKFSMFESCTKYKLKIRDTVHSVGLIKDSTVAPLPFSEPKLFPVRKSQIAAVCGHGKSSNLCLIQKGVFPTLETVSEMTDCVGFWTAFYVPKQKPSLHPSSFSFPPSSSPPPSSSSAAAFAVKEETEEVQEDERDGDGLSSITGTKRSRKQIDEIDGSLEAKLMQDVLDDQDETDPNKDQSKRNETREGGGQYNNQQQESRGDDEKREVERGEMIPESHTYLIMSRSDRTLILQAQSLQEISNHPHVQLCTDRSTLNLSNVSQFSHIVQITSKSILLLSDCLFLLLLLQVFFFFSLDLSLLNSLSLSLSVLWLVAVSWSCTDKRVIQ